MGGRFLLALAVSAALAVAAENRALRAGAAASNITPPLGALIVGGFNPFPAVTIHDELHARALVLDNGAARLAIVVCDNVGIPRSVFDAAKRAAHEKTGIPVANMLMSATHTHSGPSARGKAVFGALSAIAEELDDYQSFLAGRIADAVARAMHNLEPARIAWGAGSEPSQVFNRRWRMKPGTIPPDPFGGTTDQVRMNPRRGDPNLLEPAGPTDPEIAFLIVRSTAGRPIALLANYSLHYVGGTGKAEISADYYGFFARRIAAMLGAAGQDPPFVGIMSNGTSGNVNNIDFRRADPPKLPPYEKMRMVANMVAAEVYRRSQTLEYCDWAPLAAAVEEISVGVRVPGPKDIAWAESVLRNPPKIHPQEQVYARRTMSMKDYPARIPLLLQALRIGDVGIAAIPNEVFVETGLEIKKAGILPRTFTISLANGSYGYLPTPEHHKPGGYETWRGTSLFEPQASMHITRTVLKLLSELAK